MPHEIAKVLLENADSFLARKEAVHTALKLGMPLHEIEQYLDWLEMTRGPQQNSAGQTSSGIEIGESAPEPLD